MQVSDRVTGINARHFGNDYGHSTIGMWKLPISRKQAFWKLRTRKDCSLHRTRRSIAIGRYIPEDVQNSFHVGPTEEVTFTQLTATPYAYRDAVHFKNGRELLLQRLNERQRVKVLQLSVADEAGQPVWNAVEGSWF